MTYLELCKKLHLLLGVGPGSPGASPSTVAAQTDTLLLITTHIAQAWLEIQNARGDWLWMRASGTLNTTANVQDYSLAVASVNQTLSSLTRSDSIATATKASHGLQIGQRVTISGANQAEYNVTALITSITANTFTYVVSGTPVTPATGTIVVSTTALQADNVTPFKAGTCGEYILCHDGSIGLPNQTPVYYVDQDHFDGYYNRGLVATGKPLFYTQKSSGQISLHPSPDRAYVLTIPHKTLPTELTIDGSTPNFPSKFHMLIVYQAMMYFGGTSESIRVLGTAKNLRESMFSDLVREQTPRMLTSWR